MSLFQLRGGSGFARHSNKYAKEGKEMLKIEHPHVVWYKDLEDFVEEKLGVRPDIIGAYDQESYIEEEAASTLGATDEWLEDYSQAIVDFIQDGASIDLECLLCFLVSKNLIEAGNYLIKVWW
jgi:hypothetical protein